MMTRKLLYRPLQLLSLGVAVAVLSGSVSLLPPVTVKYALNYQLSGNQLSADTDTVTFRLSGPITVATVDSNAIWTANGTQVGTISQWDVSFHIDADSATPPLNTQTAVSSSNLQASLFSGSDASQLQSLISTQALGINIPFEGRLIPELGSVPNTDSSHPYHYRATGCLGVQAGTTGVLASKQGALCISGTFNFSHAINSQSDLNQATDITGNSNFTLVMQ